MAIVKKFNPNRIYFSKKLEARLKTIYDYPVTIAEAPVGYGKTTAVKEYLKESGRPYIWFNIDSDDREKTFADFCEKIKKINESVARRLLSIGYPYDSAACKQIVTAVNGIKYPEITVFVVDNYQYVADSYLDEIIKDLSGSSDKNVRIVVMTQAVNSNVALELIMSRRINYLSKSDFELDRDDIAHYYKACGIKLEEAETDFLYKYTEGWISALYLQMLSYVSTKTFDMTADIENLLGKAIWYNLGRASQDFMIGISVFSSFTLRQCIYIADGEISEDKIEKLLNQSGFIKYDAREGKYFMHSILKYFLEGEFERMETVFKKKVLRRAGDWYRDNEAYAEAIEFYYMTKDFEAIMTMDFGADVLYELYLNKKDRHMFPDITTNLPFNLKQKYLSTYILFVYFLFVDNKREYYARECKLIYDIIKTYYKDSDIYAELMGEYEVLRCFDSFNDIAGMKESLNNAYEYLKKPSRLLPSKTSFLLGCPSPFALYHSTAGGAVKEAEELEKLMPLYYRLTDGRGKGAEALFKAEMLLCSGELADAGKLCDKAIYMSSTREQTDVHISALMCICRIAYLRGDTDMLKQSMEKLKRFADSRQSSEETILCDMCIGFVEASVNNAEKVPLWLTDNRTIEKNTLITDLGFANIIYGKYLLSRGEYTRLLSISGQLLSLAGVYNNIMYSIYTLIYMSVAKNRTGCHEKSRKLLLEAIELAEPDNIYVPFAENYNTLAGLFGELLGEQRNVKFIKKIDELSKKFIRGLQSSQRVAGGDSRFGLTKRELEVAQLAAQRLSNKEIADRLFIAESTVKSNLKVIFNKLGINSRNDLKKFM